MVTNTLSNWPAHGNAKPWYGTTLAAVSLTKPGTGTRNRVRMGQDHYRAAGRKELSGVSRQAMERARQVHADQQTFGVQHRPGGKRS
jgi:hypothetical protein